MHFSMKTHKENVQGLLLLSRKLQGSIQELPLILPTIFGLISYSLLVSHIKKCIEFGITHVCVRIRILLPGLMVENDRLIVPNDAGSSPADRKPRNSHDF